MARDSKPSAWAIALAEAILARHGYVCLSAFAGEIKERFKRDPDSVTDEELAALDFEIASSPAMECPPAVQQGEGGSDLYDRKGVGTGGVVSVKKRTPGSSTPD